MSEKLSEYSKDSQLENIQYCYTQGNNNLMWQYKCPKCDNDTIYEKAPKKCPKCGEDYNQLKWRIPPKQKTSKSNVSNRYLLPKEGFSDKKHCARWFAEKAGLNYLPYCATDDELSDFAHHMIAPNLNPTYRTLLFQFFTELFRDGFESGDFSAWDGTGGSVSVISSDSHHGTYCMQSGIVTYTNNRPYITHSSSQTFHIRFYMKTDCVLSNGDVAFFAKCGNSTHGDTVRLGLNRTGDTDFLYAYNVANSTGYTYEWSHDSNWNCFEIKVYVDGSSGSLTVYLNGESVINQTSIDTDIDSSAYIDFLSVGNLSQTYVTTAGKYWWIDCVVSSDSYIGGHVIFKECFESGDLTNFDGSEGTNEKAVNQNNAYSGAYSYEHITDNGEWGYSYTNFNAVENVFCAAYIKTTSLPASGNMIQWGMRPRVDVNNFVQMGIYNDSGSLKWVLRTREAVTYYSTLESTASNPVADVWYFVIVRMNTQTGNGIAELWVDGVKKAEKTSCNFGGAGASIVRCDIGVMGCDQTITSYIDELCISDTTITPNYIFENGFEQGDFSAWTGTSSSYLATTSVIDTDSYHEDYCGEFYAPSNNKESFCYQYLSPFQAVTYGRAYIKLNEDIVNSGTAIHVMRINYGDWQYANYISIEESSGSMYWKLHVNEGGSTVNSTLSASEVVSGTWYCVESLRDVTNNLQKVFVDGVEIISDTQTITGNTSYVCAGIVGNNDTSQEHTVYIDCVVISDSYISVIELFEDDFESGDFSSWTSTSGSPSVQSSVTNSGTYSMQASVSDSSSSWQNSYAYKTINSTPESYTRLYVRFDTLPSDGADHVQFLKIMSGGTQLCYMNLKYDSGNVYFSLEEGGAGSLLSNTTVSTNTWYCIELWCIFDEWQGRRVLYIDGNSEIWSSRTLHSEYEISRIQVGCSSYSMPAMNVYIDDVVVSNEYTGTEQQTETVSLPFTDGFESGDFSAWNGENENQGSVDVTTSNPHCGTYCLESTLSQGQNNGWGDCYTEISGNNPVYIRAMKCIFANPPNTATEDQTALCFRETTTGNGLAYAGIKNDNGTLKWWVWYRDEGSFNDQLGDDFDSQPHHLEFAIYQDSSAGWVRLYVDGELEIEVTGLNNADRELNYASVGFSYSDAPTDSTAKFYADCVVVDDTLTGPEQEEEPPAGAEAGFETGDVSEFDDTVTSNGTVTASDSVAHHGNYSCKCDVNADGNAYAEGYFDVTEQQPVYCRGYFRFNQLPETNKDYTLICYENTDGPTTVGYIQLIDDNGTKQWKMMRSTGSTQYSTSTSSIPTVDTWVCVEFVHGENLAKLWVNGDELLTHTDTTNQTTDRVHVGACSTSMDADDTLEIYVDCIVVDNEYIGLESEVTDLEVNNLTVNNTITIGEDTNLYRSNENVLKTDDKFEANELQLGTAILSTNESVLYVKESDESPADMNVGTLTATELKTDELKKTDGAAYVLDLANMPNQGTNGYVLTAQGDATSPVWAPAGSSSVTWTAVPSSIIPISDDTYDLGSDGSAWRDIYSNDGHIDNLFVNEGLGIGANITNYKLTIGGSNYGIYQKSTGHSGSPSLTLQNDSDETVAIFNDDHSIQLGNGKFTFTPAGQLQLSETDSDGGLIIGGADLHGFLNKLQTDSDFTVKGNFYTIKQVKHTGRAPFLSNLQMVNQVYGFDETLFSPHTPQSGDTWPNDPNDGDLFNHTNLGQFYQYDITKPPEERWVSLGSTDGDVPVGVSFERFQDTKTGSFLNLYLTISKENHNAAILSTDQGFLVKKDIAAGGYLSTNQGTVYIGSGLTSQVDPPQIILMHSNASCLEESWNRSAIPKAPQGDELPAYPTEGDYFLLIIDEELDSLHKYDGNDWVDITEKGRTCWNVDTDEVIQYTGAVWNTLGFSSDFAGNFDTLFLKKFDGSPANLNACNISVGNGDTISKQENNVKYSQQFNEALWEGYQGTKNNVTQNTSDVMAPDGTQTAAKIEVNQASAYCWGCFQTVTPSLQAGQRYTMSIWLKGTIEEEEDPELREKVIIGLNDDYNKQVTLNKYWTRYTFTAIIPQGGNTARGLQFYCLAPTTATYYVYGAQLEKDKTAHTYTPTTNTTIDNKIVIESKTGIATINTKTGNPVLELRKDNIEKAFIRHNGTDTYISSRLGDLNLGSTDTGKTFITGDLEVTGNIIGQITQVGEKGSDITTGNGEKTVTFSETYSSPPLVFLQPIDASGRGIVLDLVSTTTSGFTVKAHFIMDHKHVVGRAAEVVQGSYWNPTLSNEPNHSHTGSSCYGSTNNSPVHDHSLSGSVSTSSTHTHSGGGTHPHAPGSESSHTHSVTGKTGWIADGSAASAHTHYGAGGSPELQTGYPSEHTHTISGGDGGHDHTGGSHSHGNTLSVNDGGIHDHGFTGTVSITSNGSHTHTLEDHYARSLYMRDINGSSYTVGAVLTNTSKSAADLYTEEINDSDYEVSVAFNYLVLPSE